jgi:hypothetical protein
VAKFFHTKDNDMYSSDAHAIDPANPANWDDPKLRYDVRDYNAGVFCFAMEFRVF